MSVLIDARKLANPRAGSVRIAADTMSGYSGQRRHDLRIGMSPGYVDVKRSHLNRVLIASPTPAEMRDIAETRRARRETRRAMKSNAAVATAGIITFGSEAAQMVEALSPDDQDTAFRDLAETLAAHLNTSLHALVVHLDEATIHAHIALCSYDHDGFPLSRTTRPKVLSELQDLTAEVLQRYCPEIERGTRYGDRLAAGADRADVIHKSVKELHRDLPADLADKRAELADLKDVETQARDRIDVLQHDATDLALTAERVGEEVTRLKCDKRRATDEVAALQRSREAAESARNASQWLAEIAEHAAKKRQDEAAAVRAENRAVEGRLAELEAAEAEAQTRLAALTAAEETAQARVVEMQHRVDKLTRKVELSDREAKRLEVYRGRLADRVAALEGARAAAEAGRAAADTEAEQVKAEAARIKRDAEAQANRAAADMRHAETRKDDLALDIREMTLELGTVSRAVSDRKRTLEHLKAESAGRARARDAAEAARADAESAAAVAARRADAEEVRAGKAKGRVAAVTEGLTAVVEEVAACTLSRSEDGKLRAHAPDRLTPAYPEIAPAITAAAAVVEALSETRRDADRVRAATLREKQEAQAEITRDRLALERDQKEVASKLDLVTRLLSRLEPLLAQISRWLKQPELPDTMKDEGRDILGEAVEVFSETKEDGLDM